MKAANPTAKKLTKRKQVIRELNTFQMKVKQVFDKIAKLAQLMKNNSNESNERNCA